ncbi:hypothetical protein ES705_00389 [subsurface metagenome]|nr:GNAT family N-acetyltransferase [Clostridia bacterium]
MFDKLLSKYNDKIFNIDRILFDSEIDQIYELVSSEVLEIYKGSFNNWWQKSRFQIVNGDKVAYGLYEINVIKNIRELIGTIIFKEYENKFEELSNFLELKLIYVRKDRRKLYVGTHLTKTLEEFALKNDYDGIIAESKSDLDDIPYFFLEREFVISNYNNRHKFPSYRYFKLLDSKYNQDPYDIYYITKWILDKWKFDIKKIEERNVITCEKNVFNDNQDFINELGLGFEIYIKYSKEEIDFKDTDNIKLVFDFTDEDSYSEKMKRNKIKIINLKTIKNILCKNTNIGTIPFDNYSLRVTIREDKFDDFIKKDKNVFIDGGRYGELLMESKVKGKILFSSNLEKKYIGIADVKDVKFMRPYEVWEKCKNNIVFSENEFKKYSNFMKIITVIQFENLNKIDIKDNDIAMRGWNYIDYDKFYEKYRKIII